MNVDLIKRKFWDVVRPLHSPFTKAARKRLGRNYFAHPEMELPPPYEAMQLDVERHLHCYLRCPAEEIQQIVIIGANEGDEITRLRHAYPRSRFLCFEPSPQWYNKLVQNFRNTDFVDFREVALSDSAGIAPFHELPLAGNGSLLQPDMARWSNVNKIDNQEVVSFDVRVSTLDHETERLNAIDLLWIDVQGAEDRVLKGGTSALRRTAAVFLEVSLADFPYQGAPRFSELDEMLHGFGLSCVALGIDSSNYIGNGLWLRDVSQLASRQSV